MRRRGDAAQPATTISPTTQAPAQTDWTREEPKGVQTQAPALGSSVGEQIRQGQLEGMKCAASLEPNDGAASRADLVDAGDLLTVTMGKETFFPEKFNGFDVGPLTVSVTIRNGESAAKAWVRARSVLEQLYFAEFDLRVQEYMEHIGKARLTVRA